MDPAIAGGLYCPEANDLKCKEMLISMKYSEAILNEKDFKRVQ
jgi:hypothetical protein